MINFKSAIAAACFTLFLAPTSYGQDLQIGSNLQGLLKLAKERNPDLASMSFDANAASERVIPAGSLPDPKFRTEWRDITRMGEQGPTLSPSRVGSTRYLLMQDLPWFGKRELKRETAEALSEAAKVRVTSTWLELASKIKTTYAQLYYLDQSERLTQEILDLMVRLEKVAQVRYASGLAAQQDVIRSQVEQTAIRSELIFIESERRQLQARLNALTGRQADEPLARPTQIRSLPTPEVLNFSALEQRVRSNNPSAHFVCGSLPSGLPVSTPIRDWGELAPGSPDLALPRFPALRQPSLDCCPGLNRWPFAASGSLPLRSASRF